MFIPLDVGSDQAPEKPLIVAIFIDFQYTISVGF